MPTAGSEDQAMAWSADQLSRIGEAQELRLAPRRADGTLHSFTTMWVVRANDELYVRSAGGPQRLWYRHALAVHKGRIRAGGIEADVSFAGAAPGAQAAIDAAYHAKYDGYGPTIVGHVTGPAAHAVTVRLLPAEDEGTVP
ncbi:MAG TPA: DUF2255 family protein [Acidimicrobiales bacterium]|nr:DUF2255 family protein [Acidimicrobiales bacterium]